MVFSLCITWSPITTLSTQYTLSRGPTLLFIYLFFHALFFLSRLKTVNCVLLEDGMDSILYFMAFVVRGKDVISDRGYCTLNMYWFRYIFFFNSRREYVRCLLQ